MDLLDSCRSEANCLIFLNCHSLFTSIQELTSYGYHTIQRLVQRLSIIHMSLLHCDSSMDRKLCLSFSYFIEKAKAMQLIPLSAYDFVCGTFKDCNIVPSPSDFLSSSACLQSSRSLAPLFYTEGNSPPKFFLWEFRTDLQKLYVSLPTAEKRQCNFYSSK